jgi:hypothetical protein
MDAGGRVVAGARTGRARSIGVEASMAAARRVAGKPILIVLAALMLSASGAGAEWNELLFSPNLSDLPARQLGRSEPQEKPTGAIKQDATQWMSLPQPVPFVDSPWRSFGKDFGGNIGTGSKLRNFGDAGTGGSTDDQFRLGNSYLGIQTQKHVQGLDRFWRTDCATDEDCGDYSGLPRSGPQKKDIKSFRKPFFGLSITTPLQ